MNSLKNVIIIVSGGSGRRMLKDIPKQYISVKNIPILVWSIEKFLAFDPDISIMIVLGKGHNKYWNKIKAKYFQERNILTAEGGEVRFDTVRNGLNLIDKNCIVGIHDAVRPMVSVETIRRCYNTAKERGSAIPVIETEDTIRSVDSDSKIRLNRENLRRVQTPQVFLADQIKEAYLHAAEGGYTDDATVYEEMFGEVSLVEGNPENIKITNPVDLQIAAILLD